MQPFTAALLQMFPPPPNSPPFLCCNPTISTSAAKAGGDGLVSFRVIDAEVLPYPSPRRAFEAGAQEIVPSKKGERCIPSTQPGL